MKCYNFSRLLGISKNLPRTWKHISKGSSNTNKDGKIYFSLTSPSPFLFTSLSLGTARELQSQSVEKQV